MIWLISYDTFLRYNMNNSNNNLQQTNQSINDVFPWFNIHQTCNSSYYKMNNIFQVTYTEVFVANAVDWAWAWGIVLVYILPCSILCREEHTTYF